MDATKDADAERGLSPIPTDRNWYMEESYRNRRGLERRLVCKLDVVILPMLSLIYFTHSLDRANLGNAKTDHFESDIHLQPNQYSLILVLFYIPYSTFNIPGTVLAKRFSPAVVIPVLMLCWGTISAASAAVTNFGGILAARILLGAVEAGFFPSAIYYLTLFYNRKEISKRISIFYSMGFVANAFSGLIAWRVFQWKRTLKNWQYLFIIEGCLTAFLSVVALAVLPKDASSSKLFNEAEKRIIKERLEKESEVEATQFSLRAVLCPLLNWQVWLYGCMALSYGVACASISNFLPTIIKRLTEDTVKANLYTIAPNMSGAIFIVLVCWMSDRFQQRALWTIVAAAISMIGFVVLGTADLVHHVGVGYFCTFLITFGSFVPAVLVPAWASSNMPSFSARATTLGLISGMQNMAGIISSEAFRSEDAPVYAPALITSGVFQGAMMLMTAGALIYYRAINRQLDSGRKVNVMGMEGHPEFRYVP